MPSVSSPLSSPPSSSFFFADPAQFRESRTASILLHSVSHHDGRDSAYRHASALTNRIPLDRPPSFNSPLASVAGFAYLT